MKTFINIVFCCCCCFFVLVFAFAFYFMVAVGFWTLQNRAEDNAIAEIKEHKCKNQK